MFTHYLKIAFRNLFKYKTQTIISILGLTIGVVFFAYGYHWYKFETSYDGFYPNSDRIYRMYGIHKNSGKMYEDGAVPFIAVEKLQQAFPEIEEVAIQFPNYGSKFKYNEKELGYPELEFVNEDFFQLFPPKIIAGALDNNMLKAEEIIVTENFARKHFNFPDSAIGKTLISGYEERFVIKAVIENPPKNTILKKEGYVLDNFAREFSKMSDEAVQWKDFTDARPFFLLHEKTDINKFREKLRTFAVDNSYNDDLLFEISPLTSVRQVLYNPFDKVAFDVKYIAMFIFAGILLLLAAFFNYLNILINTTFTRAREMNLRRVTGASALNIIEQLFVEMSLLILIVAFLSFFTVEITTSLFERTFSTVVVTKKVYSHLLIIIALVAILLYIFTYLFLYRFIQKTSFRQHFTSKKNLFHVRISLALQLIISVFFIMTALVFYQQVSFMKNSDWGFNKDNLLQIEMKIHDRQGLMKAVSQLPMVENIIETDYFTILETTDQMGAVGITDVQWESKPEGYNPTFQVIGVGDNFIDDFGIKIIEGRNFSEEDYLLRGGTQTNKILINETAKKVLGANDVVGEKINIPTNWFSHNGRGKEEFEIVGVIKDFHTVGLQSATPPLFIKGRKLMSEGAVNYVRVTPGMEKEGIAAINKLIPKYKPDKENELIVRTMNSILNDLSKAEEDLLKLFFTVSLLCILIAVFGIYSVSRRETQRRRKEIAIRKTAGAKTKEVMTMFFREYLIITLVACIISLPLAGLFIHRWLQGFAYRISMSCWMFAVVILVVVIIVLLTIFSQVNKASNQNPAEVVKSE
ncbi:MAG: ABC transporter permease [Petrimonas sp.]|jgi:ABC-type lipoprotein release transport system permease subunit